MAKQFRKVGITGGIGSGKSFICKLFEARGFPVYYADDRAKKVMTEDAELRQALTQHFGEETYGADGSLNTRHLAQAVAEEGEKLQTLNGLVHPAVARDFARWLERQADTAATPFVLKEAAIIFETGTQAALDGVILITAPIKTRIERVMKRNNVEREAVIQWMNKQWTDEQKTPLADFLIHNDGVADLEAEIEAAIRHFSAPDFRGKNNR